MRGTRQVFFSHPLSPQRLELPHLTYTAGHTWPLGQQGSGVSAILTHVLVPAQ